MSDKIINYKGEDVLKAVHKINFGKGGILDISGGTPDIEEELSKYKNGTFSDANYCKECNGINLVRKDNNQKYWFTNMTNGAHILDYINAYNSNEKHKSISVEGWSACPIIFVMENPSVNYKDDNGIDLYNQDWDNFRKKKFIPNRWHWGVSWYNESKSYMPTYPENFEQKAYSGLFLSIANTFKLKNAYLTNMVKCGVGCRNVDNEEEYVVTSKYNQEIVKNCILLRLKEEINALRRKDNEEVIVFAFGNNAYYGIMRYKDKLGLGNLDVYKLPHPAAPNLSNDKRCDRLYSTISDALEKHEITFEKEKIEKIKKYIKNFKKSFEDIIKSQSREEWIEGDNYTQKNYEIGSAYAIFRNRVKKGEQLALDDNISKVIYIKYNFSNNSYNVWVGKTVEEEKLLEPENFEKYAFYNDVKEIIDQIALPE